MFSRVVAAGQAQSAQHPGEECCPAKSLLWSGEMQTAAVKMRAPAEFYLFFFCVWSNAGSSSVRLFSEGCLKAGKVIKMIQGQEGKNASAWET